MKYEINVRRIVREDTVVVVEAGSAKEAVEKAKLEAQDKDAKDWECYDCEYWTDDGIDVLEVKEAGK